MVGGAAEHLSTSSTQVSLVPPPWEELTTSEPSRSATRVRPPGTMVTSRPESTKGRRSMCRGARPLLGEGGAGGQRQGGLGDVALGRGDDLAAEGLDLGLGGGGADEHAVAAGAVDFFDHELGQVREHVVAESSFLRSIQVWTLPMMGDWPR